MSRSKKILELALTDIVNTSNQDVENEDSNLSYLYTDTPTLEAIEVMEWNNTIENIIPKLVMESGDNHILLPLHTDTFPVEALETIELENTDIENTPVVIMENSDNINVPPVQTYTLPVEVMEVVESENVPLEISDESINISRLVPYSDHSDSDSNFENEKPKRKRRNRFQVNKCTWGETKNKKNRECGIQYFGRKKENNKWNKVRKGARKLNKRCGCSTKPNNVLKCSVFNEDERHIIFDQFWAMKWNEKKMFVNSLVHLIPVKRERDRKNAGTSRRSCSVLYHLKRENEHLRVCKTMFLNTLSIGRGTVLKWKKDREPLAQVNAENVHVTIKKKIRLTEEHKKLNDFLKSLPKMESHYCRRSSSRSYLQPEWSSAKALYNFYANDWCRSENIKPLSIYTFKKQLSAQDISIFTLKKDACEKCTAYKLGHVSNTEYNVHIEKKTQAREEKDKDVKQEKHVFTMDLQAVLLCPRSNVSSLYYKTKLIVHNLCIFDNKNKDGYCYLWNEVEGGVNSEEFASILVAFIEEQIQNNKINEAEKVIIYTDGCTYQNRNHILANALLNLSIMRKIEIQQKFLEVGHTQMEVDSMHATIERNLRQKIINVPAEYIRICTTARQNPKPYFVRYILHDFFKSFKDISFYSTIRPGKMKGDPKVTDLRAIQYLPSGDICYKLRFTDSWIELPQRKKNIVGQNFQELQPLYSRRLPIKKRKYEDLQQLKFVIPSDFHDFFDNLPHD